MMSPNRYFFRSSTTGMVMADTFFAQVGMMLSDHDLDLATQLGIDNLDHGVRLFLDWGSPPN